VKPPTDAKEPPQDPCPEQIGLTIDHSEIWNDTNDFEIGEFLMDALSDFDSNQQILDLCAI